MVEARELAVTPADIEALAEEVGRILYAEWAEPGAMGCGGSARIYILRGDELIRYAACYPDYYELFDVYTSINYLSKNNRVIADSPSEDMLKKLDSAVKAGKIPKPCFRSVYCGFGNYAWINSGAGLLWDDTVRGFIYRFNGKEFLIECSADEIYKRVRSKLYITSGNRSDRALTGLCGDPSGLDLGLNNPEDLKADALSDPDLNLDGGV